MDDNIFYIETGSLNGFINSLIKNYNVFSPAISNPNTQQLNEPSESFSGRGSQEILQPFGLQDEGPKIGKNTPPPQLNYSYRQLSSAPKDLIFNPYRAMEPLKEFFVNPLEKVADYFTPDDKCAAGFKKTVIFGVKSCDIAAHKIQDFVFLSGVVPDDLYSQRREDTILISSDCIDFKKVCHCLAWSILPYPNEGFDLNFSPLNDGYVVETGSVKGDELIRQFKEFFVLAKEAQIQAIRIKRENFIERMKAYILPQQLAAKEIVQTLVKNGYSLDAWQNFMLTCVECGGCNYICDTCHCFLLTDEKREDRNLKLRRWDSCQYAGFSRVAGGANPLKKRTQRFRNRFLKKFDFFVDNLGIPACCGCGRCIEVCPGKIDIREVLKSLAKELITGNVS